jgi:hypothetical protein
VDGTRGARNALDAPMSIYEVHLGSWGRTVHEGQRFPNYRDLAEPLAEHCLAHGFTHVEFLPLMEHPFYGSWGYQTTGFFAPTSRFGTPQDMMAMIDHLHQRGVGVLFDWVPSHFPNDAHGLYEFDGTHLYEHADPRQGYHPDWNSAIFNYGRNEVRSFLVSSAMCWLDRYHADGLRVDAVASMLYLDYSRNEGEWIPNVYGGRENLEAIDFMRQFNEAVYGEFPDIVTHAEESTAWGGVSRPTYLGGLGFGGKWDMGWMHDTLQYMERDPIHRSLAPRRGHVPVGVHGERELRAPAEPRRGRARQGVAAAQDAGRRLAAVRQPPAALCDAVVPARQEAAVHGVRAGHVVGVEPRGHARLEPPRRSRTARGRPHPGRRPQRPVPDEPAMHRGDFASNLGGPGMRWVEAHDSSTACSPGCASTPRARAVRCSW